MNILKIGEFSQLGRVSVRMLRYYDEKGLLKPVEVDHLSGYRLYTVEQLPQLNRILALGDLGLSLKQIGGLLDTGDDLLPVAELRGMLAMRRADLEQELQESRDRLGRVEARLKRIEREDEPSPYEVVLKDADPQTVASVRAVVPTLADMPTYRCSMSGGLYGWLGRSGISPDKAAPETVLYHITEYLEHDVDTEVAAVVGAGGATSLVADGPPPNLPGARVEVRELPAVPEMASTIHRGRLRDVPEAVGALFAWAGENGYSATGPYREVHLFWREDDLAAVPGGLDSVTVEMQLPVQRASSAGL